MILEIFVKTEDAIYVKGTKKEIAMIPFSGSAGGPYFTGEVIGPGVDTQTICGEEVKLSARYMLEGTDCEGNSCRIFIYNNGDFTRGFSPEIVTDSPVLQKFENKRLRGNVTPEKDGVVVRIFEEE